MPGLWAVRRTAGAAEAEGTAAGGAEAEGAAAAANDRASGRGGDARRHAVATASTQVKDPNYANNAATTTFTLGSGSAKIGAFTLRAQHSPLATGQPIITRLEHRTLGSKHAPHHHR